MKTYVIRIPQQSAQSAQSAEVFATVLEQLWETLRGERVALELVATGQNIAFCFSAEPSVVKIVAGLVYSAVPEADIVEVPDFTSQLGRRIRFQSCEFSLTRSDIFPLKSYKDFKRDSLSGLLSVLSQCGPGERLFFQIVIKPERDTGLHHLRLGWRKRLDKVRHIFRAKYWFKRGLSKELKKSVERKLSARLWRSNVRIGALTNDPDFDPEMRLRSLLGAVSNFNTIDLNQLRGGRFIRLMDLKNFQLRNLENGFLLSSNEISTMFHLPSEKDAPNVLHVLSSKAAPPVVIPTDAEDPEIAFFGLSNFRNQRMPFGIRTSDRRRHMYCVGKSGTGKTKLLELLIKNDLFTGRGLGLLDPHGSLVESVLRMVPQHRVKDIVLLDFSDADYPPCFNPFAGIPEAQKGRAALCFIDVFRRVFGSAFSAQAEHLLRYAVTAMIDAPEGTLLGISRMLTDDHYRRMVVNASKDEEVRRFWQQEFPMWIHGPGAEAGAELLNKIGQIAAVGQLRNIFGQRDNIIDFESLLNGNKIVLAKLPKADLGEENSFVTAGMLLSRIYLAASHRKVKDEQPADFFLYLDEFRDYIPESFDEMLREARKSNLCLTLSQQYLGEVSNQLRDAILGNVGTLISFRVGAGDAALLSPEFAPRFTERDLVNLGVRDFLIKMSIEGEMKEAFSARTLRMKYPEQDLAQECRDFSRSEYSRLIPRLEREGSEADLRAEIGLDDPSLIGFVPSTKKNAS